MLMHTHANIHYGKYKTSMMTAKSFVKSSNTKLEGENKNMVFSFFQCPSGHAGVARDVT